MGTTRRDSGLGLIETLVASGVMVIVLAVVGSLYVVVGRSTKVSDQMGAGTDQMAVALANLDAQVRSGYWLASGTQSCRGSDGVMTTCPVIKVLTTYHAAPNPTVCWVWRLSPKPKIGGGGGSVDPYHQYGRLESVRYAPGGGGPFAWHPEVEGLDFSASSLSATGPFKALIPATLAFRTGLYSGVRVLLSVAQDPTRRLSVTFDMAVRNRFNSGSSAVLTLTCPWP